LTLGSAILGAAVMGGFVVGGGETLDLSIPVPQLGYIGKRRAQMGCGYDHRLHNRAYRFTVPTPAAQTGSGALTITTISGAILGILRTETQYSPISGTKFTRDRNGCADASLLLCSPPDFEILPFAVTRYAIDGVRAYAGSVTAPPELPTTDDNAITYKIFGFRRWLEQLQPLVGVFDAGTDITEIMRSLVQGIGNRAPIIYDEAKFDAATGTVIAADIDVTDKSLKSIFDFLAGLAQTKVYYYVWKVDEDGAIAWTRYVRDVFVRTFYVGYDLFDFKPSKNFDTIKNTISGHREAEPGSGDSGFGVIGPANDTTSVAKYGRLELIQKIPGFISDADGETYLDALLADLAEPKYAATGKTLLRTSDDLLPEGAPVRVVMPFGVFRDNLLPLDPADIDEYSDFEITGTGDLTATADDTIFVFADGSIRFDFESAAGQVAIFPLDSKTPLRKIFLYMRATRNGTIARIGVGKDAWNERTAIVSLKTVGDFYPIVLDFTTDPLFSGAGFFGVEILNDETTAQSLWIDKLDGEFIGNKTYKLILESATYDLSPTTGEVALKFGQPAASIVDYVAALQVLVSDMQRSGKQT